jgi:hypothetical protein
MFDNIVKTGLILFLTSIFAVISAQETATTEKLVLSSKSEIKKGDKSVISGLASAAQDRLDKTLLKKSTRRAKLVSLNMNSLKSGRIDMEFFDGLHVLLGKQREETTAWGSFSWCGNASKAGANDSIYSTATITISADGKRMCGSFVYHKGNTYAAYWLAPLDEEGKEHVLVEKDPVAYENY